MNKITIYFQLINNKLTNYIMSALNQRVWMELFKNFKIKDTN